MVNVFEMCSYGCLFFNNLS